MEGVTDFGLRLWIALVGAPPFMWTPFLRITDTYPQSRLPDDYAPEFFLTKGAVPYRLIPQIMASNPERAGIAATMLLEFTNFVDLNCGCPAPKVVGHGAGSSLLQRVDQLATFLPIVLRATGPHKLSVKMRTGFDNADLFTQQLAVLREMPLQQLTVHGRTRAQRYTGKSNWQLIAQAASTVPYPVVGSGDIMCARTWEERRRQSPGCDSFIVGRGALRNPWIFTELANQTTLTLSVSTMTHALGVFGILQHMEWEHLDQLKSLANDGWFAQSLGDHEDSWSRYYERLLGQIYMTPENVDFPRAVLSRIKMIWNYLRSSLPSPFFEPMLFRSSSWSTLRDGLIDLAQRHHITHYEPQYQQTYDRFFGAGETSSDTPCS